jgi:hypothetical protein
VDEADPFGYTRQDQAIDGEWPARGERQDTSELGAALQEDWAFVLRDVRTERVIVPAVAAADWDDAPGAECGTVWWPDGSGVGIRVHADDLLCDRIVEVADMFQESEVEALWMAGRSATWPSCPQHPDTHPLQAEQRNGIAVWTCPTTSAIIAAIGSLTRS